MITVKIFCGKLSTEFHEGDPQRSSYEYYAKTPIKIWKYIHVPMH